MGFAEISYNHKVWEVLYASVCLQGEEREEALRRLQIPAEPVQNG